MNEGKKDRRDPIRTTKPRNFVAKNAGATTSGAGVHKDKKKADKQGYEKHKGKEYAESLESKLKEAFEKDSCPVCGCTPCNCTHIVKEDSVNEVSQDWNEQWRAGQQLADLFNKKMKKGNFTAQDLELAKSLVKITGRAFNVGRGGYRKYTAGNILDDIVNAVREKDVAAGKTLELTRAPTTREMAKQIAAITKGRTAYRNPTTWSTNYGDRYRDAADHVEYDDEAAYNAAWKFIQSKGKQVHYKEGGSLHTAIQIGSYIIEPSSRTMGYFSDNPETTHSISVRTVKSLGGRRQKQDISDEQAAQLQQVARNRNDAALTLLKVIFKVIGEKDAAETIANSKKLSPAEKTKLGKIVAKGQQGVAEGSEDGLSMEDMVIDQYYNGNEVWEIARYLGIGEKEVQDIIDRHEQQGVAEGSDPTKKVFLKVNAINTGMPKGWHRVRRIELDPQRNQYYVETKPGYGIYCGVENRQTYSLRNGEGMAITVRQADAILNDHQGVAEAAGLYGPFTATINTGERPQSHTKTKRFKREDDAILWAEDWLENAPQYVFATAEVTDPDGNVVWTTDESLEEVSLDLAKRARDKAEHMVDMDYDDMRDKPYGHSEKQRIKFQRYIDKKEPRAKGDRDWSPPEQGVAESEYDPSYDPEYRGYQKPEQDPDAWKQARDLAQPNQSHSTVIVYDATRKEVLRFPSTGGYYGDVKYALSKGYNTESDDYDIKWQRDVSEDQGMTDIADWKQAVLKAYPRYADHIKFKGRGTQVSAEVPGMDRSFGVFDLGTGRGEVLDEGKIYLEKLTNALAEAVRKL